MEKREQFIQNALSQEGYQETGSNQTKYATELNESGYSSYWGGSIQGQPWCAMFCQWVAYVTFCEVGPNKLNDKDQGSEFKKFESFVRARAIAVSTWRAAFENATEKAYFTKADSLAGKYTPQRGDVIFFNGHVGLVVESDGSQVKTIEGNTSDMVAQRTYDLDASNIVGYGILNWEAVGGSNAIGFGTNASDPLGADNLVTVAPEILEAEITGVTDSFILAYIHYFNGGDPGCTVTTTLEYNNNSSTLNEDPPSDKIESEDSSTYYTPALGWNIEGMKPNTSCALKIVISNNEGAAEKTLAVHTPESYPDKAQKLQLAPIYDDIDLDTPLIISFKPPSKWGYWSNPDTNGYLVSFFADGRLKSVAEYPATANFFKVTARDLEIPYGSLLQVAVQPFTQYIRDTRRVKAICPKKQFSNVVCLRNKRYFSNRFYMHNGQKFTRVALVDNITS